MKKIELTKVGYSNYADFMIVDVNNIYGEARVRLNGRTYTVKYSYHDGEEYGLVQEPAAHMEELLLYSRDVGWESYFSRKRFKDAFQIAREAINIFCEEEMLRRAYAYDEFNESYDGDNYLHDIDEFLSCFKDTRNLI